jgi:hypothetical protein
MVRTSLGLPVETPSSHRPSIKRRPTALHLPSPTEVFPPAPASARSRSGARGILAQSCSTRPWTASAAALASQREILAGGGGEGGRGRPGNLGSDVPAVATAKTATLMWKAEGRFSSREGSAGAAGAVQIDRNLRSAGAWQLPSFWKGESCVNGLSTVALHRY